jgi:hypothetical protein
MKTVVRAGLVAILATALAAPAQAATVKQVTSTCRAGEFSGVFTLRYDTSGGYHHPIGSITTSGPYIGDTGTQSLRISYNDGLGTHTVYTRVGPATNGTQSLPAGLAIPATARGTASTTFDNGTTSCVATVPIT